MSEVKRYMADCNLLRSLGKVREEDVIVVLARDYDALAQQLAACEAKYEAARDRKNSITLLQQQLVASEARLADAIALLGRCVIAIGEVGKLDAYADYDLVCEVEDATTSFLSSQKI